MSSKTKYTKHQNYCKITITYEKIVNYKNTIRDKNKQV